MLTLFSHATFVSWLLDRRCAGQLYCAEHPLRSSVDSSDGTDWHKERCQCLQCHVEFVVLIVVSKAEEVSMMVTLKGEKYDTFVNNTTASFANSLLSSRDQKLNDCAQHDQRE